MRTWSANPSKAFWLIWAIVSTTLAVVLLCQMPPVGAQASVASSSQQEPAHIIAFPLQLGPGLEGIAVIDGQNYTICLYQYQPRKPAYERFELVAARNFRYDCQLQQFNTDPPLETVKQWLLQSGRPENAPGVTPQETPPKAPAPSGPASNRSITDDEPTDDSAGAAEK